MPITGPASESGSVGVTIGTAPACARGPAPRRTVGRLGHDPPTDAAPPSRRWGTLARRSLAVAGCGMLFLWLLGRAFNDRWAWSQLLWYMPTLEVVLASGLLLLPSAVEWFRRAARATPLLRRTGRASALVFWCAALMYLALAQWRLWRPLAAPAPAQHPVRVFVWNPSWEKMAAFHERVLAERPDVVLLASPHYTSGLADLRAGMGGPTFAAQWSMLTVISRYPIVRWGGASLRIRPEGSASSWFAKRVSDAGRAMFVELECPPLGGKTVLWFVDLPSDPFLSRRRGMAEAAASLAEFRGPTYQRNPDGTDTGEPLPPGPVGFPVPDIAAGDFNTPRGSGSMSFLCPRLENAYDQAGWGPSASFPRAWPLAHIDQTFVGPRLRATYYDTVDLGAGRHRAQVVDVATRP